MPVGDISSDEVGSAARYNDEKPDFSLIPLCTLEDEAKAWAYGKAKYAEWNWLKGCNYSVPFASLMRHLSAWQMGEEIDRESNLPHLSLAMCNLRMLVAYTKLYKEFDDRPTKWLKDFKKDDIQAT